MTPIITNTRSFAAIKRRFNQGAAIPAIANYYKVSQRQIHSILRSQFNIKHKVSPQSHARIIKRYQKGVSTGELSISYGVTKQTIINILKHHKVYVRVNRRPGRISKKDWKTIVEMYDQGCSSRAIGRRFEISHQHVCNILEWSGVDRRTEWSNKKNTQGVSS